jgi:membrane protease YdiL (CAAX protease family)
MKEDSEKINLRLIFLVVSSWFIIDAFIPYLNRIFDFKKIHSWLLPAINMALMFSVTYFYVMFYEKKSFSEGFNFTFQKFRKSILWAFIFFLIAGAVLACYQIFIVMPLAKKVVEASGAASQGAIKPFWDRLIEYFYVVYEGIIEVFIFIGFFLDRLARKWNWPGALIISNIVFALWHYSYWEKGLLEGSLMIFLTFIVGIFVSMSYFKTKNSLSPVICHFLVDAPNAIRELLGLL